MINMFRSDHEFLIDWNRLRTLCQRKVHRKGSINECLFCPISLTHNNLSYMLKIFSMLRQIVLLLGFPKSKLFGVKIGGG